MERAGLKFSRSLLLGMDAATMEVDLGLGREVELLLLNGGLPCRSWLRERRACHGVDGSESYDLFRRLRRLGAVSAQQHASSSPEPAHPIYEYGANVAGSGWPTAVLCFICVVKQSVGQVCCSGGGGRTGIRHGFTEEAARTRRVHGRMSESGLTVDASWEDCAVE